MTDPKGWTVGDLEPALGGTAGDGTPLAPVSLAAAIASTAHIRRADATVISRAVVQGNQSTAPGTWTLPLVAGDLTVAGGYSIEVEVMWPGERPQTYGPVMFQVARQIA